MDILDIAVDICEAQTEKEMSYRLAQAKREFSAMFRSAKNPSEAYRIKRDINEAKQNILYAIGECEKFNEVIPKVGIGVSGVLALILGYDLLTIFNDFNWYSLFFVVILSFAMLLIFLVTIESYELLKFIKSKEPQNDLENFVENLQSRLEEYLYF